MEKKKINKTWSAVILSVCAVLFSGAVLFSAVTGDNATSSDPLISLSYLNDVFRYELMQDVQETVDNGFAALEFELDKNISGVVNAINTAGDRMNTHAITSLPSKMWYTMDSGADFLMLSGDAALGSGGLLDVTTGAPVAAGEKLIENHLYIVSESATIKTETNVKLLLRE